jgi:hypothetical protein
MAERTFGEIEDIPVGTSFQTRKEAFQHSQGSGFLLLYPRIIFRFT